MSENRKDELKIVDRVTGDMLLTINMPDTAAGKAALGGGVDLILGSRAYTYTDRPIAGNVQQALADKIADAMGLDAKDSMMALIDSAIAPSDKGALGSVRTLARYGAMMMRYSNDAEAKIRYAHAHRLAPSQIARLSRLQRRTLRQALTGLTQLASEYTVTIEALDMIAEMKSDMARCGATA